MFRQLINSTTKVPAMLQSVRLMANYVGPKEKCMNMVQLLGRVGADPVVRTGEKYRFVTFDIATSSQYPKKTLDGDIEYITKTEWHNINAFRPGLVDKIENSVQKGTRLLVNGSLEYRSVQREDGSTVEYPKVVVEDVIILASAKEREYQGY